MKIQFYKYQGTGNDFVLIDNRNAAFERSNTNLVKKMCDRSFGIGADGLMLLQNRPGYDFEMVYYNSDGNESSMCGNGGRCLVAFAHFLGIITGKAHFIASDGEHFAFIANNIVRLKMNDVKGIEMGDGFDFLNTGSPHYIKYVDAVRDIDVYNEGKKIRYNERFKEFGTNVNFVQVEGDSIIVRTYERGVEGETYSCGTGVTAAVLSYAQKKGGMKECKVKTLGGDLQVSFNPNANGTYTDIWLEGPAALVFEGVFEI